MSSSNQQQQQQTARNRALWSSNNNSNNNDDGEGELEMLQRVHLQALESHPEIRNALKTKELQDLIRNIDKSKCRLEALAAAEHNVPQFKQFCELLLGVIYGVEDARHRYNY